MSILTIPRKIYDLLTGTGVKVDDVSAGTQTYLIGVDVDNDININDISKGIQTNDLKVTLDTEQVNIADISKGTQTNDVKVTLDTEQVNIADISKGTQTNDVKVTLDSEQVDIGDISKGTQTHDVKVTLDTEQVNIADISKGTQTNDVKVAVQNEVNVDFANQGYFCLSQGYKDYAAKNLTQIIRHNGAGGINTYATIYTVPANKVLYITSAWIHIENSNTSNAANGAVVRNTNTYKILATLATQSSSGEEQASSNSTSFPMPIKFVAGEIVKIWNNYANATSVGGITGWIEDA